MTSGGSDRPGVASMKISAVARFPFRSRCGVLRQIERQVISQPLEAHTAFADRHVRRGAEKRRLIDHVALRIRRHATASIELEAHARRASTVGPLRADEKRGVELHVPSLPFEVQPLGPGTGSRGHVGHGVEAIHRAQDVARIRRRPRGVGGRVAPRLHAGGLGIVERTFEAGYAALSANRHDRPGPHQKQLRAPSR